MTTQEIMMKVMIAQVAIVHQQAKISEQETKMKTVIGA